MSEAKQTTVLLADDEETLRDHLAQALREEGFSVIACADGTQALRTLRTQSIGAIITDLRMPGVTGLDLIDHAARLAPDAVIIVITAFGEVETAVKVMRKGVCDFICKPLVFDEVIFKLKRLLAHDDPARANRRHREPMRRAHESDSIVGESPAIPLLDFGVTDLRAALREFEKRHIARVLAVCGNNKGEAAHALGIGLSSLYRKLEELGLIKEHAHEDTAHEASS